MQKSLTGKTRILVTHALHFLPQVDYIYCIENGTIAEEGTYADLMTRGGEFSQFITEFGSKEEEQEKKEEQEEDTIGADDEDAVLKIAKAKEDKMKKAVSGAALMQAEERNTGAIAWPVYRDYMKAGHGEWVMPALVLSLVLMQGATVLASYW